jgi:sugar lactone lactonase YvrE
MRAPLVLSLALTLLAGEVARAQEQNNMVTVAGTDPTTNGDGGPATQAFLNIPNAVAFDTAGNLYICDGPDARVRKVDAATGIITTFAGTGTPGFSGDSPGPATSAKLRLPDALAFDAGNLYVADSGNNRIRKISPAQDGNFVMSTFVATGLNSPDGIAFDGGYLYIADSGSNRILKVDASGNNMTVYAGTGAKGVSGGNNDDNGPATSAKLSGPGALAFDGSHNLYISDSGDNCIRKVDTTGTITTFVAPVSNPGGLHFDASGNLFVCEISKNRVLKVAADGTITVVAGTSALGFAGDGGPATRAQLKSPIGLTLDSTGNLFTSVSGSSVFKQGSTVPAKFAVFDANGVSIGTHGRARRRRAASARRARVDAGRRRLITIVSSTASLPRCSAPGESSGSGPSPTRRAGGSDRARSGSSGLRPGPCGPRRTRPCGSR